MLKRILKAILSFLPPFMRPTLIRMYYTLPFFLKIPVIVLPRALYLRFTNRRLPRKTESDLNNIMHNLDYWVFNHSGVLKHDSNGYLPADLMLERQSPNVGIQQVREEIAEFAKILLLKDLKNSILEIGLGNNGGTHMLWRYIFNTIVSVELDIERIIRFKLSEWLDSRSKVIMGDAHKPRTQRKVRNYLDSVDVLFIDGGHRYEEVSEDWAIYHDLVRPGGIVAFHGSVSKFLDFGIARFLEDLSRGLVDGRRYTLHHIVHSANTGISYYEQS